MVKTEVKVFTKLGNELQRGSVASYGAWIFIFDINSLSRLYDDSYSAAYCDPEKLIIESYCEGDTFSIKCESVASYKAEIQAYLDHNKDQ